MSAPNHESPVPGEAALIYVERKAMLERLEKLERSLRGINGPGLVHATIAIENLRARLLRLVP